MLLQYGSNPDLEYGYNCETCLMAALNGHHTEVAKVLVEAGANIQAKDALGRPVLTFAVKAVDIRGVAFLLLHNVKFCGIDHKLTENSASELNYEVDLLVHSCCEKKE